MTTPMTTPTAALAFGPYALDAANATLARDGERLDIAPKSFDVLALLAARAGQLVTKEEILDAVWGRRFVSESAIKSVISDLRAALDDDARTPRYIETVSRRGYRFIGRAEAAPAEAAAPAAPARDGFGVVDRESANAVLARALDAARQGRRRVVLVAGEAGVGKTTLLSGFAHGIEGAALAVGQCVEHYGAGEPYLPVLEALNALCAADPGTLRVVRDTAPTWLVQMPWHLSEADRAALQRDVTGASQGRMLREMGVLLERLAASRPLVLLLEDLHWSDAPTVQLLDHLARRRAPARLLIVATFRPADTIASDHPIGNLRRELRVHGLCDETHLDGFTREQVARFVAMRCDGAEPDPAFVEALERHTGGLPLFLGSVLDELAAQGLVRRDEAGAWSFPRASELALPLPDNLLGLAEKQISRLPAETRQMLEAAALSAAEFDHLSLAAALGTDPSLVRERLDGLARRRLWLRGCEPRTLADGRVAMRYAFLHALFRHAFAHRTGAAARLEIHRRLGQALEALHGPRAVDLAGELALHHAEGGDAVRAGHWYAVGAQQAMQRLAPNEALALADRGLMQTALLDEGPQKAAELPLLAVRIAALMVTQGYSSRAAVPSLQRAQQLIEALPPAPQTLPLWHALWWSMVNGGAWDAARSLARRLSTRTQGGRSTLARAVAHNLAGMVALFESRYDDAVTELRGGLDAQAGFTADERAVPFLQDLRVEALSGLLLALEPCARFEEADAVRAQIHACIDEGTDPLSELLGLWFMACGHQLRGETGAMRRLGERALALMRTRDALPGHGPHHVSLGWALAMGGDLAGGVVEVDRGIRHYERQRSIMGRAWFRASQAEVKLAAGRLAQAAEDIGAALQDAGEAQMCVLEPYVHRVHGAVCQARGDAAGARLAREHSIALARGQGALLLELHAVLDWARAHGHRAEAAARLDDVLQRIGPAPSVPAVRRARGQLDAWTTPAVA